MTIGRPIKIDREQAREALVKQFWQCGYTASSARDLQTCSGLSSSSLYRSFGNKETIFSECLNQYTDDLLRALSEIRHQYSNAKTFFERLFLDTAKSAGSDHARLGCLVFNSIAELGKHNNAAATSAKNCLSRIRSFFEEILASDTSGDHKDLLDVKTDFLITNMIGLRIYLKSGADKKRATALAEYIIQSAFD